MRALTLIVGAVMVAGCTTTGTDASPSPDLPAPLELLVSSPSPFASGQDTWEVWLCKIPSDTTHDQYDADQWRLTLTPDELARILQAAVPDWFRELSHGQYRPRFRAGGTVKARATEGGEACADRALAGAAASDAEGLFVVADAAHRSDSSGGWGRPGQCDPPGRCPAARSGRAVYVGAGDFAPLWNDRYPFDLIEHEMGHALDLPHSATDTATGTYGSALDVMSNPAAPREADRSRRHGQDTLAANRLALGWLPVDAVEVVESSAEVRLAPSTAAGEGRRVLVLPLDARRMLTVELRVRDGLDLHLPTDGVAVHLVDQSSTVCVESNPCTGQYRRQTPVHTTERPYTDLLEPGERVDVEGWTISVRALEDTEGGPRADVVVWRSDDT